MARVDLHVHSKHSNRPTEWLLRRVAAAESYTEPLEIYRKARARGMDFVTITDHDTIDGALEIAHLPGTFLSCEVTTAFPDDGCQIHLLTLGITEGQFREIDRLRGNLYELRDYLRGEGVLCSVAHPLFRVNERLTVAHVEKLLVLFDRFEGASGVPLRVFSPWLDLPLGQEAKGAKLAVPPILEILDLCERERYSEIVVGTPGPLGLVGLLAARLLGVPVVALVRTDVPAIVQRITREVFFEDLARNLVRWFYRAADRLLVATRFERELLLADGFAPERIEIVAEAATVEWVETVGESVGAARC
ncbi:MAG TPA: glycosyltransferase [Thermoanaerobaculia bacterium]|jgi:hypothetical protein|nr:glycosyltransferase [Thermoanaerobaculia bacterium]